jgi:hypothetical protein
MPLFPARLRGQRIGPYAKALQGGRQGVAHPLTHCRKGGRSGRNRGRGQREQDDQSVPYAARITGVKDSMILEARVCHVPRTPLN